MLKIVEGDIIFSDGVAAICHQVNCQSVMGSGVAKAIYQKWPEVKQKYHEFCSGQRPEDLLGKIQVVDLLSEFPARNKVVINVFGQLTYGRRKICYTDYDALAKAFDEINKICAFKTIAFPYGFGCGLAGGDWVTVEKLMLEHLYNVDVVIYMKTDGGNKK